MTTMSKRGLEPLRDPALDKSTVFGEAERQALGLVGLAPDVTEDENLQLRRVMLQLRHKHTDIDRYIYLVHLFEYDEALFYRAIMSGPVHYEGQIFLPGQANNFYIFPQWAWRSMRPRRVA